MSRSAQRYALVRGVPAPGAALTWTIPDETVSIVAIGDDERAGTPGGVYVPLPRTTAALATTLASLEHAGVPYVVVAVPGAELVLVEEGSLERAAALEAAAAEPAPTGERLPVIPLRDGQIRLGQFLKLANLIANGSDAKPLLEYGRVQVNGVQERRRGRQLVRGDVVTVDGHSVAVG